MIKAIPTRYFKHTFRSRLEARWAIFFKECGVNWRYENEGYKRDKEGICYLPDFVLRDVPGYNELFVEVKGLMQDEDAAKIKNFAGLSKPKEERKPILVLGDMPHGNTLRDILCDIDVRCYKYKEYEWPNEFNFYTIDGDYYPAIPGVDKRGRFVLFRGMHDFLKNANVAKVEHAYDLAIQEQFNSYK